METDPTPPPLSLWQELRADFRRYQYPHPQKWYVVVFLTQGFWATCAYRLSRRILTKRAWPLLGPLLKLLLVLWRKLLEILTGIHIPDESVIGKALHIAHFGPTLIGVERMGDNCSLSQGVTIGYGGRGEKRGRPTIGDRVYIGANVVIVGDITIGDDAAIAAGAIVVSSVPPRGVVMGNPARVIGYEGSFDLIHYEGMETDPARKPQG